MEALPGSLSRANGWSPIRSALFVVPPAFWLEAYIRLRPLRTVARQSAPRLNPIWRQRPADSPGDRHEEPFRSDKSRPRTAPGERIANAIPRRYRTW